MASALLPTALLILAVNANATPGSTSPDIAKALETLRRTGLDGINSQSATRAWQQVARLDVSRLTELLAAMDGANDIARNWLRSAADPVLDRARAEKKPVPLADLQAFVADRRHDPQSRRFAYELIVDADHSAAERILPGLLDDPSPDLRHDAVARLLDKAEKLAGAGDKTRAVAELKRCLAAARDKDQVDKASGKLKELGHPVDLARQYGFIQNWHLLGPFPNPDMKGVETAYPPEKAIDLTGVYDGKAGKIRWKNFTTSSDTGRVDLKTAIGKESDGIAYALADFTSDRDQPAEIRLACVTTLKAWVNGEQVLARYDALTGSRWDSYIAKVKLMRGKNQILLKLCKDAAPLPVYDLWWFQMRVCDDTGAAVLSTTRPAPQSSDHKP